MPVLRGGAEKGMSHRIAGSLKRKLKLSSLDELRGGIGNKIFGKDVTKICKIIS